VSGQNASVQNCAHGNLAFVNSSETERWDCHWKPNRSVRSFWKIEAQEPKVPFPAYIEFRLRDELSSWVARHEHLLTSGAATNLLASMRVPILNNSTNTHSLNPSSIKTGAVKSQSSNVNASTKSRHSLRRLMQDNQKLKRYVWSRS
jgi:hypothetical protein